MCQRLIAICITALVAAGPVAAQEESADTVTNQSEPEKPPSADAPPAADKPQVKSLLGISILGNEEAPKSLVIVPWKSSEIGEGIGVMRVLDDRPVPVDKDVFMRELRYYEIRSNSDQ
jgi:hypothetical protein